MFAGGLEQPRFKLERDPARRIAHQRERSRPGPQIPKPMRNPAPATDIYVVGVWAEKNGVSSTAIPEVFSQSKRPLRDYADGRSRGLVELYPLGSPPLKSHLQVPPCVRRKNVADQLR